MSKSLGNGIDPLEIVDEHGADALKFTLAFLFTPSQDILIDKDDFKLGSKFANKVWNASRYILMNLEGRSPVAEPARADVDRWILHRLNSAAAAVEDALSGFRFNDAAAAVYEYFWNDFCDWYIEATKLSLKSGDEAEKDRAMAVLLSTLAEVSPPPPSLHPLRYRGDIPEAASRRRLLRGRVLAHIGALSRAVAGPGRSRSRLPLRVPAGAGAPRKDAALRIPDSARGQDAPRPALRAGLRGLRLPARQGRPRRSPRKRPGARIPELAGPRGRSPSSAAASRLSPS